MEVEDNDGEKVSEETAAMDMENCPREDNKAEINSTNSDDLGVLEDANNIGIEDLCVLEKSGYKDTYVATVVMNREIKGVPT